MKSANEITMTDQALLLKAKEIKEFAYAPYSLFHVGAAIRAEDGRVITGVNVENASYSLGICAERAALSQAVSMGVRPGDIEAVAVTAPPCGGCRQWLLEFRVGRIIFESDGDIEVRSASELLPWSFSLST
tara:strand:- start:162 stop:554 length:393 start_codon:yes stop_codon:yes gene_type:complete